MQNGLVDATSVVGVLEQPVSVSRPINALKTTVEELIMRIKTFLIDDLIKEKLIFPRINFMNAKLNFFS